MLSHILTDVSDKGDNFGVEGKAEYGIGRA